MATFDDLKRKAPAFGKSVQQHLFDLNQRRRHVARWRNFKNDAKVEIIIGDRPARPQMAVHYDIPRHPRACGCVGCANLLQKEQAMIAEKQVERKVKWPRVNGAAAGCGCHACEEARRAVPAHVFPESPDVNADNVLAEIRERPVDLADRELRVKLQVNVRERLGSGAYKSAYALADNKTVLIVSSDKRQLNAEFEYLEELRLSGVPVLTIHKVYDNVDVVSSEDGGILKGRAAFRAERMAFSNKDGGTEQPVYKVLNDRSLKDIEAIRNGLINNKLYVADLQFLIADDGRVVINDPLGVYTTSDKNEWDYQQREMEERLDRLKWGVLYARDRLEQKLVDVETKALPASFFKDAANWGANYKERELRAAVAAMGIPTVNVKVVVDKAWKKDGRELFEAVG
jgi:hypothetical protein